jgi:hypothetical protein
MLVMIAKHERTLVVTVLPGTREDLLPVLAMRITTKKRSTPS